MLRFPTPLSVTELSLEAFAKVLDRLIGRRVHKRAKIQEIYDLTRHGIALLIREDSPAMATFPMQFERYLQLCETRNELDDQADALLRSRADYRQLKSLPGVGPIIALVILADAGDVKRFGHHRQFLKFCGLDLCKSQSGVSRSREQLSKSGNARLGCALWIAALSAVRMREHSFRDNYQGCVAQTPDDAVSENLVFFMVPSVPKRPSSQSITWNEIRPAGHRRSPFVGVVHTRPRSVALIESRKTVASFFNLE